MYEIWLALNIAFEVALSSWPYLLAISVLWLVMMFLARHKLDVRALRDAIVIGLGFAVLAFFAIPSLTHASLDNMGYWIDWAILVGFALGCGVSVGLLVLPIAGLRRRAYSTSK